MLKTLKRSPAAGSRERLTPAQKKSIRLKIFITIILSISLSVIILSIVLDAFFERSLLDKIFESERNNLYQARVSIRLMQNLSRDIARQMYGDYSLSPLLFVPRHDPVEVYRALISLEKYCNLIAHIDSIYIYNPKAGVCYITSPATTSMIQEEDTFFDARVLDFLHKPEYINSLVPIPRMIAVPGALQGSSVSKGVYTFVFNQFGKRSTDTSSIIINISEAWLRNIIDSLDVNPENKAVIIDATDRMVVGHPGKPMLSPASLYGYLEASPATNERSGYLVVRKQSGEVFLVYSRIDEFAWVLIKEIPYATLMRSVIDVRTNMILVSVVILLAGAVLSVLLSQRLAQPFDRLLEELKTLENGRKDDATILQRHRLNQLLTRSSLLAPEELISIAEDLPLAYRPGDRLSLLLMEIDGSRPFRERFSEYERNLLRFGMLHAAEEVVGTAYGAAGGEVGDKSAVLVVNVGAESDGDVRRHIGRLARAVQARIDRDLHIPVSVTVGPATDRLEALTELYEQYHRTLKEKYTAGERALLDAGVRPPAAEREYVFPLREMEKLLEALAQGNRDEAMAAYNDITVGARAFGYERMKIVIDDLAYKTARIAYELKGGRFLDNSFDVSGFLDKVNSAEMLAEADEEFRAVFAVLTAAVRNKDQRRKYAVVGDMKASVARDYGKSGLSLALLADTFGFSAAYLGRLFHEATGTSFPEYVNHFRIDRAAAMLRDGGRSISEVMVTTGFTNKTHFYTMFKKYHRMTPREFRRRLGHDPEA